MKKLVGGVFEISTEIHFCKQGQPVIKLSRSFFGPGDIHIVHSKASKLKRTVREIHSESFQIEHDEQLWFHTLVFSWPTLCHWRMVACGAQLKEHTLIQMEWALHYHNSQFATSGNLGTSAIMWFAILDPIARCNKADKIACRDLWSIY